MGFQDRDYARQSGHVRPRGGGGGVRSIRTWSVNTWIIAICCAVFVIDFGFLGSIDVPVEMKRTWIGPDWAEVDEKGLTLGELVDTRVSREGIRIEGQRTIFFETGAGQAEVGTAMYQYMRPLESVLHFSTDRGFFRVHFWRLIGFQFLHAHLTHLLMNMIGLFFFGPLVERYLGSKRYLAFYLLCGIFGALMYVLLNVAGLATTAMLGTDVRIPGLLFNDIATPLIGASAGVFGVIMAGAFLRPNDMILLFFIIPMRLVTLAYGIVAVAFFTVLIGGDNAGGEAGHIGGAIAGFYFIRHSHHLHGFFDLLGRIDPTSHHYRRKGAGARQRAVVKAKVPGRHPNAEIDRILDKVQAEGLASLSRREKRILQQATEKGRS